MTTDDEDDHDLFDDGELDLLVVIRLSNHSMGRGEERQGIEQFGEDLGAAVLAAGVGEYDGDEIGGGEWTLFFCGTDIDALIAFLRPLLQRSPFGRSAHFVRLVEGDDGEMHRLRVPL